MNAPTTKIGKEDFIHFAMGDKVAADDSGRFVTADIGSHIDSDRYISEEFYNREKEAIWKHAWLLLARASVIEKPGDYFLFDLHVLDAKLIVVKGRDGKVRAFRNTCPHRGAPVCYPRSGNRRFLTCPFHGWVFDLDGALLDIPDEDRFPEPIDKSKSGLMQVSADIWGGFIFINMNPETTLAEYLVPVPDELRQYLQNENLRWIKGYKRVFATNWKTTVDVQAEGYHANSLHKLTVAATISPKHMPLTVYPKAKGIGYRICTAGDPEGSYEPTEVAKLAHTYGASVYLNIGNKEDCKADKYPGAMNPNNEPLHIFDEWNFFPGVCFFVQKDHIFILRAWPLNPNETQYEIDHYFIGEFDSFKKLWSNQQGLITLRDTLTEDLSAIQGMQVNFRSGAFPVAKKFSDLEVGVLAFQRKITDWIDEHEKKNA